MPVSDRFKVSVTENSDNYKKYSSSDKDVGNDGVRERLLPNSQDDSLPSAMETGLFITFALNYCGVVFSIIRAVFSTL